MAEPMRGLSIRQPWAGCIAHLDKRVENRTWRCPYRYIGAQIAIHAGATIEPEVIQVPDGDGKKWASLFADQAEWDAWRFWKLGYKPRDAEHWPPKLALGAVVAVATITGCHDDSSCYGALQRPGSGPHPLCSPWAMPHQFHWVLSQVQALPEPVRCKGKQGLWALPEDVERAVREQLEASRA